MYKLHILFVDSDPMTHERMQQALGKDCILHSVRSMAEAKEFLLASLPDMLISEVTLSQEDGLDLCHYVRSTPTLDTLPIMLLTSRATIQDKVAGFQAGADDYVVKPFDARHLIARIPLACTNQTHGTTYKHLVDVYETESPNSLGLSVSLSRKVAGGKVVDLLLF